MTYHVRTSNATNKNRQRLTNIVPKAVKLSKDKRMNQANNWGTALSIEIRLHDLKVTKELLEHYYYKQLRELNKEL